MLAAQQTPADPSVLQRDAATLVQLASCAAWLALAEQAAKLCSFIVLTYAIVAGAAALPFASQRLAGYSFGTAAASALWWQAAATTSLAHAQTLSPELRGYSSDERSKLKDRARPRTVWLVWASACVQALAICAQVGLAMYAALAPGLIELEASDPTAFPSFVLVVRVYLWGSVAAAAVAAVSLLLHCAAELWARQLPTAFVRYLHRAKLHMLAGTGWLGLPELYAFLDPAAFCVEEIDVDLQHRTTWYQVRERWARFLAAVPVEDATQLAWAEALRQGAGRSMAALVVLSLLPDQGWVRRPGMAALVLGTVAALVDSGVNILAHNACEFLHHALSEPALGQRAELLERCTTLVQLLCTCCTSFLEQGWPSPAPMRALKQLLRFTTWPTSMSPLKSSLSGKLLARCEQPSANKFARQRVWSASLYLALNLHADKATLWGAWGKELYELVGKLLKQEKDKEEKMGKVDKAKHSAQGYAYEDELREMRGLFGSLVPAEQHAANNGLSPV